MACNDQIKFYKTFSVICFLLLSIFYLLKFRSQKCKIENVTDKLLNPVASRILVIFMLIKIHRIINTRIFTSKIRVLLILIYPTVSAIRPFIQALRFKDSFELQQLFQTKVDSG